MESLLRLYFEGGPVMFLLFIFFLAAFLLLLIQLIIARKIVFPGLFLGLAMAIFALAMVSMARDYKMALEVLPSIKDPNPIHFFGTNEIACIPILFALSMLAILLILQMGADLLSGRDLIHLSSPLRFIFLIRGLSLLGLLVSSALCISVVLIVNRQLSEAGTIASENIAILVAYLRSSIVTGLIAMLLSLVVVAVSLISPISQIHISRNVTASPS